MKRIFTLILFSISLYACTGIEGKIENRNNSFYLVNKSKDKIYTFTVKKSEVKDGKEYNTVIEYYNLYPGAEELLGSKYYNSEPKYPIKTRLVLKTHKPLTQEEIRSIKEKGKENHFYLINKGLIEEEKFKDCKDTIINGEKLKFIYEEEQFEDKSNPLPVLNFEYNYEVTGQVEIKK